jgi:hypothetical protein
VDAAFRYGEDAVVSMPWSGVRIVVLPDLETAPGDPNRAEPQQAAEQAAEPPPSGV